MVAVPGDTPVTIPDIDMEITGEDEVQTPPMGLTVSGVVAPTHKVPDPTETVGDGLTVTTALTEQPEAAL